MKINKTAILVEKFGWALFPRRHELWLVNQDGEDSHIVEKAAFDKDGILCECFLKLKIY
jgi:hypothetical protein